MNISNVGATTVRRWLSNDEAILIDVREPAEHSAIHIDESKNIPLGKLKSNLPLDCDGKKLVFHCRSGARSQQACEAVVKQFADAQVFNLEGGIISWEAQGHDVQRSGNVFLPLDRQVQLTIGVLLVVLSIVSYFISPIFILLIGFVGAGLSVAGLTGYCGMAMLIAKMPWNQQTRADIPSSKSE